MNRRVCVILFTLFVISKEASSQDGDGWRIAIIDSGIFDDHRSGLQRMDDGVCYSRGDQVNHNVYNPFG